MLKSRARVHICRGDLAKAASELKRADDLTDGQSLEVILWQHIVERKAGRAHDLRTKTKDINLKWWPGPVAKLFMGEAKPGALLAGLDRVLPYHQCEADFLSGIWASLEKRKGEARKYLEAASGKCESQFTVRNAKVELERLGQ
jgi:hypothetical protein